YGEARGEFEKATKLLPDKPNAYRWLGLTDEKLGHCRQSVESFDTFLSLVDRDDPRVAEVNDARTRCQRKLAADQTAPPKGAGESAAGSAGSDRETVVSHQITR